jgi:predicted transcriptional regulator
MDTVAPPPALGTEIPASETEEHRRRRLACESKLIDEGLASIAAGRVVSEEAFDAWIDSIGTDRELPPPRSGR